jgi:hydrogenase nickel insertion protein HypA
MHELSITRQLIEMIRKEAENKIKIINSVTIELGSLTAYKKEPLLFYFDALKRDFPFIKNTKLTVNEVVGKLKCNSCRKESRIDEPYMIFCPLCKSNDVVITRGKDFNIIEIKGR